MYLGLQGSGTVFGAQDVDVDRVFNRVWERNLPFLVSLWCSLKGLVMWAA